MIFGSQSINALIYNIYTAHWLVYVFTSMQNQKRFLAEGSVGLKNTFHASSFSQKSSIGQKYDYEKPFA